MLQFESNASVFSCVINGLRDFLCNSYILVSVEVARLVTRLTRLLREDQFGAQVCRSRSFGCSCCPGFE